MDTAEGTANLRMARRFVVRASGVTPAPQAAPEADVTIRMVEYAFSVSAPLTAGRQMIRPRSAGTQPHEIYLAKLAPGKTVEDVLAWRQTPASPAPLVEGGGGLAGLDPGTEAYFDVDLAPGEYVLLCFATAPDGRPHIARGMIQQIRVD